jgi:hypothetical protein
MDFYRFVSNFIAAERIVTQMYPVIVGEFEKRFNIPARKAWIDIVYNYTLSRHEIRVIIETERERYYIPIGEISDTVKLYGIERAFKLMLPPAPAERPAEKQQKRQ